MLGYSSDKVCTLVEPHRFFYGELINIFHSIRWLVIYVAVLTDKRSEKQQDYAFLFLKGFMISEIISTSRNMNLK